MIAYNSEKVLNLLVCEKVKTWWKEGVITLEQQNSILLARINRYSRSTILYRIGIFCLTTIAAGSVLGIFGLTTGLFDPDHNPKFFLLLMAFLHFGALFFVIKEKQQFKSGIDDAFLYWGLGYFIACLQLTFNKFNNDFALVFALISLPVIALAAWYFIDRTLSVLTFFNFLALLFLLALKTGIWGKVFLPFILMFASALVFFIVKNLKTKEKLFLGIECLDYISICSLICFYLAGNYYVVREASVMLMNLEILPGNDIPYAFLFYIFTVVVPLVYIYVGLKNKSNTFLTLGLVFTACAILSLRYYYSVLPPEIALIAGGSLLLGLSYFTFSYLKIPRFGITTEKNKTKSDLLHVAAEALVIAQTFTPAPEAKQTGGTDFGGGEFGGGGAGSGY